MKKLTVKENSFAAKIIEGLGPSAALRASKYKTVSMNPNSIKVQAQKLLNLPHIALTIENAKKVQLNKAIMTREQALKRLSSHANIKITDIYDFTFGETHKDKTGAAVMGVIWKLKNIEDISPDVVVCIKSISCGKNGPVVELYDSDGAIKQLSLMQGWNAAQQYDHSSTDGTMSPTRELSDDEIKKQLEVKGLRIDFDK